MSFPRVQEVLPNFRGRAMTAELPKLARPEVGTVPTDAVFGVQKIFHPVLNKPRDPESLQRVIQRIQRYAYTEGVRIGQFFRVLSCNKFLLKNIIVFIESSKRIVWSIGIT